MDAGADPALAGPGRSLIASGLVKRRVHPRDPIAFESIGISAEHRTAGAGLCLDGPCPDFYFAWNKSVNVDGYLAQRGTQIMTTSRPTAADAVEAWKQAFDLETVLGEQWIRLIDELAQGEPIPRKRASEVLEVALEKIDEVFEAIKATGGQFNDEGDLIGNTLTLKPTRHSFRVNGNDMYAWCSLDTILLPGGLETTGEIESTDPVTGDAIRLTVTPDEVVEVDPPTTTSVFLPGLSATETRNGLPVGGAESKLCRSMLFFSSRETAEEAFENLPNIAILTVDEAFELARPVFIEPSRSWRPAATTQQGHPRGH